jgi:hypothetical protein
MEAAYLLRSINSGDARHNDIGDQEMNGTGMSACEAQSLLAIARLKNMVAALQKQLRNGGANGGVIFKDEHGFVGRGD